MILIWTVWLQLIWMQFCKSIHPKSRTGQKCVQAYYLKYFSSEGIILKLNFLYVDIWLGISICQKNWMAQRHEQEISVSNHSIFTIHIWQIVPSLYTSSPDKEHFGPVEWGFLCICVLANSYSQERWKLFCYNHNRHENKWQCT